MVPLAVKIVGCLGNIVDYLDDVIVEKFLEQYETSASMEPDLLGGLFLTILRNPR